MSERLLSIDQVAQRLGVVPKTVRRKLTKLQSAGLQKVEIGDGSRLIRFRESSLDRMIKRSAEFDEPLLKNRKRVRQGAALAS